MLKDNQNLSDNIEYYHLIKSGSYSMSHTMSHNYSQLWVSLVVEPIPENREISTHRLGQKT